MFQSLSGFPMSCNSLLYNDRSLFSSVSIPIGFSNELQHIRYVEALIPDLFQSLSGFPMSCNVTGAGAASLGDMFQSLSGFPMSCNSQSSYELYFSGTFQSLSGFPMSCNRPPGHPGGTGISRFQSLSGFPMSCNSAPLSCLYPPRIGFNPYRVFQ